MHAGRRGPGHTTTGQGHAIAVQGRETAAVDLAVVGTGVEGVRRGTDRAVHQLAVNGRGQDLSHVQEHQGERFNTHAADVQ